MKITKWRSRGQRGLVYTLDKAVETQNLTSLIKGNMKNQNRRFCSVLQERKTRGTSSGEQRAGACLPVGRIEIVDRKG